MNEINSVMLIDDNEIDNFITCKILEYYGVTNIVSFKNVNSAVSHLKKTEIKYQLILVDICMPLIDGFGFIKKFYELELCKAQGEIYLLSTSLNPAHKNKAIEMNIKFIDKPFTIEKLLINGFYIKQS